MSTAVHASSLSSLTSLASNPPNYPRNPTQAKRDPLVLYIARVPGSRDVFLTTMKPRRKVVTSEDVSSSLYYLHVDQDEHGEQLTGMGHQVEQDEGLESQGPEGHQIHRRPLPPDPQLPLGSLGIVDPKSRLPSDDPSVSITSRSPRAREPPYHRQSRSLDDPRGSPQKLDRRQNDAAVDRKPLGVQTNMLILPTTELQRRPLGPRPEISQPKSSNRQENTPLQPIHSGGPSGPGVILQSHSRQTPSLSPRLRVNQLDGQQAHGNLAAVSTPVGEDPAMFYRQVPQSAAENSGTKSQAGHGSPKTANVSTGTFSVTLIRRDPTSASQWNVGKIFTAPELPNSASSSSLSFGTGPERSSRIRENAPPIHVELDTPGYNKFKSASNFGPVPIQEPNGQGLPRQTPTGKSYGSAEKEVFRRMIWAEGSWFERNIKHRRLGSNASSTSTTSRKTSTESKRSSNGDRPVEIPNSPSYPPGQRSVAPSLGTPDIRGIPDQPSIAPPPKSNHLVFLSPWNGRCDFSTGAGGRTVRCKHTLPTLTNASTGPSSSVLVSELRFNFPQRTLVSGTPSSASSASLASSPKRSSRILDGLRGRKHQSVSYNETPEPVDDNADVPGFDARLGIRLGQEKAGGGNRGNRAKLGKLVVEDEGLKMVDLVVAANMGIWWRVWGRVEGE